MLNENHNQNGVLECGGAWVGSGEQPMIPGCSARGAEGAGQDGDVQSPRAKVQSHVAREAEFEFLRLKTSFGEEHGMENGKSRTRTRTTTRTKNRNDKGMAIGALCLIVPPNSCGHARDRRGKAPSRQTLPAQSMTMWAVLESWCGQARVEFELRRLGFGMSGRRLRFGGGYSPISTYFHLLPRF